MVRHRRAGPEVALETEKNGASVSIGMWFHCFLFTVWLHDVQCPSHCVFFRQNPLEAIFVIFGRRALIFFVWKLLEKIKNDATFIRMRSGDHLGDAKNVEKGTSLRRI